MTRRLVSGAVAGLFAAAFAGGAVEAVAQTKGYVPGTAPCVPGGGYVCNAYPTPTDGVVKSAAYNSTAGLSGNLCYRTGYWTPAMAIIQCDPDLVPKPPAPRSRACSGTRACTRTCSDPGSGPGSAVQKITLASKALFDFDKYALKPEGKAAIDSEIIAKLPQVQKLELVLVTGHTDRIGSQQYNQKLSERRADAVRDYLVSKGVPKDKIETLGMGKTQPLPGVVCTQKNFKELIACLAPNRRVEIEVKGEATVRR